MKYEGYTTSKKSRCTRLMLVFNSGRALVYNYHQLEVIEFTASPDVLRLTFDLRSGQIEYIIEGTNLEVMIHFLQVDSIKSITEATEIQIDMFDGKTTLIRKITEERKSRKPEPVVAD